MTIFTLNSMHVGLGFVIMRSYSRIFPNNGHAQGLKSDTAYLCNVSSLYFFCVMNKLIADGPFTISRW